VGTRITIGAARPADMLRLQELSVRTHQLNSGGKPMTEADFADLLRSPDHQVETLRLADDFGDDGLVGGAILTRTGTASITVPLIMMSCRALGRGALDALLAWVCRTAAHAGATKLAVPCLVTDRNVPMRLALAAAGLRANPASVAADGRVVFTRALTGELPELPDWVTVEGSQ
jgi:FkbH-like protein